MSLSEQEQRTLREIEQSLLAEDPKFGNRVPGAHGRARPSGGGMTMRSAALLVAGLVLLIGGVALATVSVWFVALSVVGFAVMLAGGIVALRTPAAAAGPQRQAAPVRQSARAAKLEENFRRRFEGQ
ncbi:DUF3040 domain-containing protein [Corynebacterium liangguodongii]|uniref:DUF3040 domain-containing protein n=1 Tax=Corynebacterium liangguodongii TaxID=2079535 RepID=A0A2S0WFB9_9CORY|nr:DUF3040 domain-containing protein [Corynebacterium liangguodongii]AWB84362.1 DUF3040 domain-containing protein [Corynebacterium liangguodongii]PWB99852.1 DUF3040 domain-containing protein [Corynebacterium liangguodongii]